MDVCIHFTKSYGFIRQSGPITALWCEYSLPHLLQIVKPFKNYHFHFKDFEIAPEVEANGNHIIPERVNGMRINILIEKH